MAISASAVGRVTGITTKYFDNSAGTARFLPHSLVVLAQGREGVSYSTARTQIFSAVEAADAYGYGSPVHLAAERLFPASGNGIGIPVYVHALAASTTASAGTITPVADQTTARSYRVVVNGVATEWVALAADANVAAFTAALTTAINNKTNLPITAADGTTVVNVTAKWKGATGDDITLSVETSGTGASTFALVQPTGGAGVPSITTALSYIGDNWDTAILNCLGEDSDTLDELNDYAIARWETLVHKPLVAFYGDNETNVSTAITVPTAKRLQLGNAKLCAPGSAELPFVIGAAILREVLKQSNADPARDYGSIAVTDLTPGAAADVWDYAKRETAVTGGVSTTLVRNGVVTIADVFTFYHPVGDDAPAYRKVCDIYKNATYIYNLAAVFERPEWDGAPLLEDTDETVNPDAKKPKNAVTAVNNIQDALGGAAILSRVKETKKLTTATIAGPDRLQVNSKIILSGTTRILDISHEFGFNFGGN